MTRERWTYPVIIEFFGKAVTDREATIGGSVRVVWGGGSVRVWTRVSRGTPQEVERGLCSEEGGLCHAAFDTGSRMGYRLSMQKRIPNVLTIAGSDPSGGAGIQADLKAFSALGAYGCAAITALTAQSTRGVTGVHLVPPGFVREQLETLLDDVRIDAVKIGMIATADIARAVASVLRERKLANVVLDRGGGGARGTAALGNRGDAEPAGGGGTAR